jgi:hypothetical protein
MQMVGLGRLNIATNERTRCKCLWFGGRRARDALRLCKSRADLEMPPSCAAGGRMGIERLLDGVGMG